MNENKILLHDNFYKITLEAKKSSEGNEISASGYF